MADIYLSKFGDFWTNGSSVNSIEINSADGWVYLAGGTGTEKNQNLAVWAFQDGQLVWRKDFGGAHGFESFSKVVYKDGFLYVAGAIGNGFDSAALLEETFPTDKPISNRVEPEGNRNTAPIFVKLEAETGDLVLAKVFDSNVPGFDQANNIVVDEEGSIFVSTFGGVDGVYGGGVSKYSADGELLWFKDNASRVNLDSNGNVYLLYGQDRIDKYSSDGNYVDSLNPFPDADYHVTGYYTKDFVVDSNGDMYVAYSVHNVTLGDYGIEPGLLTSAICKVSGLTGDIIWSLDIDPSGASEPASISIDNYGNLLLSGYTWTDLNGNYLSTKTWVDGGGVTLSDRRDGYLIQLDPNGDVLNTTLIGAPKDISIINQAKLDPLGNVMIAGDFKSNFYSIENSPYQNIYLISDENFVLMGNELDNAIQGGEGDDKIFGGIGDDVIIGGSGNDALYGGEGFDTVSYEYSVNGVKIDLFKGKTQALSKSGKAEIGLDKISGFENAIGGSGDDYLVAGKDGSELIGGDGNDTYVLKNLADIVLDSGGDADWVIVDFSVTDLEYSLEEDIENGMLANKLNLNLAGNSLDNILVGNAGSNILTSGFGDDSLTGGKGVDYFLFDQGGLKSIADLGNGADVLQIYEISDIEIPIVINATIVKTWVATSNTYNYQTVNLISNGFAVNLDAINNGINGFYLSNIGKGTTLIGSAFDDSITGGSGADKIKGGFGNDVLTGGNGKDVFTFDKAYDASTNVDTITDFFSGTDKINLSKAIFTGLGTKAGKLTDAQFAYVGQELTSTDRIIYDTETGGLYYDVDGSDVAEAIQIALLGLGDIHPVLSFSDFTIM